MTAEEREMLLEMRKGLLIQVHAIERRCAPKTVTIVLKRDEAQRLGLTVESSQT